METTTKSLESLRPRIEEWRRSKTWRCERMPEHLWNEAAGLARIEGVYAVSHALRLNYDCLKDRVSGPTAVSEATSSGAFVELEMSRGGDGLVVEFFGHRGGRMRIEVTGSRPLDLANLAATFWSQQS